MRLSLSSDYFLFDDIFYSQIYHTGNIPLLEHLFAWQAGKYETY